MFGQDLGKLSLIQWAFNGNTHLNSPQFMNKKSMPKKNRALTLFIACSAFGLVLGGFSSRADSYQCAQAKNPTTQCLSENPNVKTLQGMLTGLLAGGGAAIGTSWKLQQDRKN